MLGGNPALVPQRDQLASGVSMIVDAIRRLPMDRIGWMTPSACDLTGIRTSARLSLAKLAAKPA